MSLALTLKYYIKYKLDNPKNPPKQGNIEWFQNLGSQFVYVVWNCDEALLGRDGYRRLADIGTFNLNKELDQQPILDDDEYQENSDGIVVNEQEIGNGVYQSIRTLLQTLIPIWNKSVSPILQPGDTINLKLSGDGRNVDHKQNHVMLMNNKK